MNYDEVFSFENLYKAHIVARRGKRHKKEVIEFEMNTGSNIAKLYYEHKHRRYVIGPYHTFYIYEPKKRRVDAISYRDRIVQHCLCDNYLMPLLEKRLVYDNSATRKNKGTDFARSRLKKFYYDYFVKNKTNIGFVLKCDIHHYFETIDHDCLINILKKIIFDQGILMLCIQIIDSYNSEEGKGLPIGNQTSQAFAILYLDEVDRLIKEKFKMRYYSRYMDDFIIISKSKNKLKLLLKSIKELLDKYKLKLNKKSRIYKLKESINYLGFNYKLKANGKILMLLNYEKKKRFCKKTIEKIKLYFAKRKSFESVLGTINSYNSHIKKGTTFRFQIKYYQIIKKYYNARL